MDADLDMINFGQVTEVDMMLIHSEVDMMLKRPETPNELKNITDNAFNHILRDVFCKM